jgi:hypothetical protein
MRYGADDDVKRPDQLADLGGAGTRLARLDGARPARCRICGAETPELTDPGRHENVTRLNPAVPKDRYSAGIAGRRGPKGSPPHPRRPRRACLFGSAFLED